MNALKPQKGKAFDKLPKKTLDTFDTDTFLVGTKFDGNQIFIVKEGSEVSFYTSDWKPFYIAEVASNLRRMTTGSYIAIGEFMHDCEGKLGDRPKSAILTTYRTNFKKSIDNNILDERKANIRIFDFLDIIERQLMVTTVYESRISLAAMSLANVPNIKVIRPQSMTGKEAIQYAKTLVNNGWEGIMLHRPHATYQLGKRVNYCVKLKYRKTADLKCIAVEPGEGKYTGMIGALLLQDSRGRRVSVGSGLTDGMRSYSDDYFLSQVIEIEYEQIMATYIQPTFLCKREDKTIEEID